MATAAPARKAPARKPPVRKAPARKAAPSRQAAAPARKAAGARSAAPARKGGARAAGTKAAGKTAGRSAAAQTPRGRAGAAAVAGGQLIPLAVGRTAVAVRGLPDCRPVVRLTRGRAWIALLGLLLAGIVALNVATLSLTATAGEIEAQRQTLREENSLLQRRLAQRLSNQRVQAAAAQLGLARPDGREIAFRTAGPAQIQAAAERLQALAR